MLGSMGTEIERKFLVDVNVWQPRSEGTLFRQGYLSVHPERTVRVRIEGDEARLTIKGQTRGISRIELEYAIPVADAHVALTELCEQPIIEKRRHVEDWGGKRWEIDVFAGDNTGLVLAEIELDAETEAFERPPWAREDVSADRRYYNANLVAEPFRRWGTP